MPVVLSVCNMKGGVGKTAVSILVTRYLALKGHSVLLIDADPQATATAHALPDVLADEGIPPAGIHVILQELAKGGEFTPSLIVKQVVPVNPDTKEFFYIMPNAISSVLYTSYLESMQLHFTFFTEITKAVSHLADVVVIDYPPYFSPYSYAGLRATRSLLIPAEASIQGFLGTQLFLSVLHDCLKKRILSAENLEYLLIVPTKFKKTTNISRIALERMREAFRGMISDSLVPYTDIVNKLFAGSVTLEEVLSGSVKGLFSSQRHVEQIRAVLEEVYDRLVKPFLEATV